MKISFDVGNWKHPDGFVAEYLLDEFLNSRLYEETICQKCSRFKDQCTDELSPAMKECPFHKIYRAIKTGAEILEDVFYAIEKYKTLDEIDDDVTLLFNRAGIRYKHEKEACKIQ